MGYTIVNNVTATVATQSNSGSASLVVGTGLGASFATATTASPIRCGAFDSTGALKFFFDVTARATDTLTIANRGAESTVDANILTTDVIAAVVTTGILTTLPLGLGVYGDGSDGAVTFDGTTTILGLVPSSSVYTLTRDLFLAAGTINNGVLIKTNGFRIFCQGTLTNNGTIHWNATSSTAVSNANSSISVFAAVNSAPGGGAGAGGSTTGVAGSATNSGAVAGTLGGTGGAGGTGPSGAGGAGGTPVTLPSTYAPWRALPGSSLLYPMKTNMTTMLGFQGGTGGGGGGGDGTNGGGGGGGGGGIVFVAARAIAGAGSMQARGANGTTPVAGNTGGGGGGGGGLVVVISGSVSGGAVSGQTIDANGGTKGSPHGTGTDNAANGGAGTVVLIPN